MVLTVLPGFTQSSAARRQENFSRVVLVADQGAMHMRETLCSVYYSLLLDIRILKVFMQCLTYAMMRVRNFFECIDAMRFFKCIDVKPCSLRCEDRGGIFAAKILRRDSRKMMQRMHSFRLCMCEQKLTSSCYASHFERRCDGELSLFRRSKRLHASPKSSPGKRGDFGRT